MQKFTVSLETVTPLFLGGAEPEKCAELRAPSIRGALRFWYRAIDPDHCNHVDGSDGLNREEKIFGSSRYGQGEFLLRINKAKFGKEGWKKDKYSKKASQDGITYFSYPLETGKKKNDNYKQLRFIGPGTTIDLEFIFKKEPNTRTKQAILASLWLLVNVGGLGTRSRRGFGTLKLKGLGENGAEWKETKDLFSLVSLTSREKWFSSFQNSLKLISSWFSISQMEANYTRLGPETVFCLFSRAHSRKDGFDGWEYALNEAGRVMQDFRNRKSPDYQNVKDHLARKKNLQSSPERACFGLPLTFQYSSLRKEGYKVFSTTFHGCEHERSASPVFVRVVNVASCYYAFFAILDSSLLPSGEKVKEQSGKNGKNPFPVISSKILSDFLEYSLSPKGESKNLSFILSS